MKKIVLAMLLVAAVSAVAQTTPAPAQASPQTAAPAAQAAPAKPAAQKKEIKDPAEYNAYVGAIQQQDAAAKISGLEAFLTQYPNSVMKEDALELLMSAYGQTNNAAKAQETALKVLQANPCNLRGLALLSFTKRAAAEQGGPTAAQSLTEAGQYGEKGLQCEQTATKPEGTSDADFAKLKSETAGIFNGAAGMAIASRSWCWWRCTAPAGSISTMAVPLSRWLSTIRPRAFLSGRGCGTSSRISRHRRQSW